MRTVMGPSFFVYNIGETFEIIDKRPNFQDVRLQNLCLTQR